MLNLTNVSKTYPKSSAKAANNSYNEGNNLRFVKSPEAPKMTNICPSGFIIILD